MFSMRRNPTPRRYGLAVVCYLHTSVYQIACLHSAMVWTKPDPRSVTPALPRLIFRAWTFARSMSGGPAAGDLKSDTCRTSRDDRGRAVRGTLITVGTVHRVCRFAMLAQYALDRTMSAICLSSWTISSIAFSSPASAFARHARAISLDRPSWRSTRLLSMPGLVRPRYRTSARARRPTLADASGWRPNPDNRWLP